MVTRGVTRAKAASFFFETKDCRRVLAERDEISPQKLTRQVIHGTIASTPLVP
jgi:hypothetical protein